MLRTWTRSIFHEAYGLELIINVKRRNLERYKVQDKLDLQKLYLDQDVFREEIRRNGRMIDEFLEKINKLKNINDKIQFLELHAEKIKNIFGIFYQINDYTNNVEIIDEEAKQLSVSVRRKIKKVEKFLYNTILSASKGARKKLVKRVPGYTRIVHLAERFEKNMSPVITEIQDTEKLKIVMHYKWKQMRETKDVQEKINLINEVMLINEELCMSLGYNSKINRAQDEGLNFDVVDDVYEAIFGYINQLSKYDINNVPMKPIDIIMTVRDALKKFYGREYVKEFDNAFKKGYVIKSPSGNYTQYGKRLNKVLLYESNDYAEAFSLAHEMGHYVENVYCEKYNNSLTKDEEILLEVPSILNEYVYLDYMMNEFQDNKEDQKNILKYHLEMLINMTAFYFYYIKFEVLVINAICNSEMFKLKAEELLMLWNSQQECDDLRIDIVDFSQIDFLQARYLYGTIIALRIYNKIKADKHYLKTYLKYMELKETMNFDERLKFLGISIYDETLIADLVDKINEIISKIESL